MPRQETIIQIFVGSPGDVSKEREALEYIVTELNRSWSKVRVSQVGNKCLP